MDNSIFQSVFDKIQDYLPSGWNKMILYIAYNEGSYSMKYYTCGPDGIYVDCYSDDTASKAQLIRLFMSIDKILSKERKSLEDDKKWTVMTMVVDSEGKMTTDFDYSDISENSIEYERNWRKKYIGE